MLSATLKDKELKVWPSKILLKSMIAAIQPVSIEHERKHSKQKQPKLNKKKELPTR